jgi:putative DNA methylase
MRYRLEKRFVESVNFPFDIVSEASAVEKGPGRPPHWEMVFWWTRKPLISARAIIAGCLLPEKTSVGDFLLSIGVRRKGHRPDGRLLFDGAPHRVKPRLRFDGVKLLDPFAGFGSIPLEGLRLGLDVTAVELLPVPYVFLKAVLEYPAKYGERLVRDVEKWGRWVTERLREDPLIRELYEDDVAVYIGSWEVKCPHCGRWTPLVGNWWLARVKAGDGYARLAWMEPVIEGNDVKIKVVDLNKVLGNRAVEKARVSGLRVTANGKEFRVPESNIEAKRERAVCLICHQPIMQIDPQTGKHYTETKSLPKEVKERLKGYVKFALELYNKGKGYGTSTELLPWISEAPARQRLLVKVKVKQGDLELEPCTEKDQEKLDRASKEMEKMFESGDPDLPSETLWRYAASGGGCLSIWIWGFDKFYKLFNPRQLLILVKLVKLIREASKQIEQEKIKEGLSKEAAFKYAEAVTGYLTIALARYADYNSAVNRLHSSNPMGVDVSSSMAQRGIAIQWNTVDVRPFAKLKGWIRTQGSWVKCLENVSESVFYLVFACSGSDGVDVFLDDATVLNKLNPDQKFGLIVTDPPYYDDVPYAELSDFYYVWLKRTLSEVKDGRLVPKFLPEAFFEKIGDGWVEVSTQWEKYALSEVSLNPPRLGSGAGREDGVRHFQNLLNASFITMTSKLEDNGMLVTYYAHTDPDAWKALLEAGWEAAGLRVTNAFPLTTESTQSVVKRGKLSMDTSIMVVWRKKSEGAIEASELYNEMVEESAKRARELMDVGAIGRDWVIGTLATALATATKYREVRVMGSIDTRTLVDKYVYPASYLGLARALARKAELKDGAKSTEGMFYLLVKSALAGAKEKILESTDARMFSIGTSLDLNAALKTLKILKVGKKESGAKVAKAKTLALMEPVSDQRSVLAEFLEARGVGIQKPAIKCSVDALHVLEYFAVAYPREEFRQKLEELRANYPAHVEEALTMARIMAKVLPGEDMEKKLCSRVVEHLSPTTKLDRFMPEVK